MLFAKTNNLYEQKISSMENFFNKKYGKCRFIKAINKKDVTYNRQKIYLHTIDRILLQLFSCVMKNKKEMLVTYPVQKFNLFAPLAVEAFWISNVGCKNSFIDRNKILLVTERKDIREDYSSLQRSDGIMIHAEYFPIGIIGSDRKPRLMKFRGCTKKQMKVLTPYFLVSPSLKILPTYKISKEIATTLIEINDNEDIANLERFRNWNKGGRIPSVLYISTNPLSKPSLYLKEKNIPIWGWNEKSLLGVFYDHLKIDERNYLKYRNPLTTSLPYIMNVLKGITYVKIPVEENKITKLLLGLRKDYIELIKNESDVDVIAASRRLLTLIYSLEEMLAPYPYSDKYLNWSWGCLTIEDRKQSIINLVQKIKNNNPGAASFLNGIISKVENLQEIMKKDWSGKSAVITKIIDEAVKREKSIAVVHRIDALKSALIEFLIKEKNISELWLNEHNIFILSQNELNGRSNIDSLVYYGTPRYNNLSILQFAGTSKIGFLLYQSEHQAMDWIFKEKEQLENWFSYSEQMKCLSSITDISMSELRIKIPNIIKKIKRKHPKIISTKSQEADIQVVKEEDVFNNFLNIDESLEKEDQSIASIKTLNLHESQEEGPIKVMVVHFSNNRILYIPINRQVPIYNIHLNKIKYVYSSQLEKSDMLILVNNTARQGLADAVIKAVETHPKMIRVIAYQQLWLSVLKDGMLRKSHRTADVSLLLEEEGISRTSAAVYQWINGHIIGPQEKEVIKAIGKIYTNQHLLDKLNLVWNAVKRLRKIHISIGLRIKYLAPHSAIFDNEFDDQIVDDELNLHLSDFKKIISIEEIKKIKGPTEIEHYTIDEIQNEEVDTID